MEPIKFQFSPTELKDIAVMEVEIEATVKAYKALLEQAWKLAISMGHFSVDFTYMEGLHNPVLRNIMPRVLDDHRNWWRIKEWFEGQKEGAVARVREQRIEDARRREEKKRKAAEQAARKQKRLDREKLIASLNLTPEQIELLGVNGARSTTPRT